MLQHIDELAKRVAQVKPPYAPGFIDRPVLDGQAGIRHPLQRLLQIIHLNRQIRTGVSEPPWLAKLSCTDILAGAP